MSETHRALVWDQDGERFYHNGVSKGVLYLQSGAEYPKGVAWNGLSKVTRNPEGAEPQDIYADNIKYASFRSAENDGGNITAYMWPDEWYECDGFRSPSNLEGMHVGQQKRKGFGLCYRTEVGNDTTDESDDGYILHIVYGATASPSDQDHETINENPSAVEYSWDYKTTPVKMATALTNSKPTSYIELESLKLGATKMAAIEAVLYGSTSADARLPLPDEIASILAAAT